MEEAKHADGRLSLWRLLYRGARLTLARRYNYTCEPITTDSPCLIIANHVTNSDPFLLGLAHGHAPLTYVASEHIFRQGLISKLITKLLDPIPRSKAASGASTVKNCLRRLKNGESVALFAEGDCTWDGVTGHVFPATGKLAKAAGVPLVTFRIEGGYLTRPRWSKRSRRGKMRGVPVRAYGVDELKTMTAEQVTEAIDRDIFYDTWAEQRKNHTAYRSKAHAEGLERALFICPECGGADCMASKGERLFCKKCGAEWTMDDYGFLHGPRFDTIAEWDAWQKEAVKKIKSTPLFQGRGVFTDINKGEKRVGAEYALDAEHGSIRIGPFKPTIKVLPRIDNMAMVKTNRLLFEDSESYFEIKSKRGVLRPYLLLWQALRNEKGETNEHTAGTA